MTIIRQSLTVFRSGKMRARNERGEFRYTRRIPATSRVFVLFGCFKFTAVFGLKRRGILGVFACLLLLFLAGPSSAL